MTSSDKKRPVPGIDTPAEDDIITPCAGRTHGPNCTGWVVARHPRHTTGGTSLIDPKTGRTPTSEQLWSNDDLSSFQREWKATPEWVEAEAARISEGGTTCSGCERPELTDAEIRERDDEKARVDGLLEYV